jgi:hypothetical protein
MYWESKVPSPFLGENTRSIFKIITLVPGQEQATWTHFASQKIPIFLPLLGENASD